MCIPPQSQTPRFASKHLKKFRGVHPTAESDSAVCITPRSQAPQHHTAESSSAVCIIPRRQTPRCASYRGGGSAVCITLRSYENKASDKIFAVCIPPRSRTLRCASYHRVKLRSVHNTAESVACQVSVLIQNFTIIISL